MYSPWIMRLFHGRTHEGELEDATHYGQAGEPGCGPYMQLWLQVDDRIVRTARFRTYGCPVVTACGEVVCARSEGEPLATLAGLSPVDVTRWIGGVPEGKEHCPELAATSLRRAVGSGTTDEHG